MLSRFSIFNNMSSVEMGATLGAGLAFTLCVIKLVASGHFDSPCEPNCSPIAHFIVDTFTTAAGTLSGAFIGTIASGIRECLDSYNVRERSFSPEAKEEKKLRAIPI